MTPADFFATLEEHLRRCPTFYPVAAEDVEDLTDFYVTCLASAPGRIVLTRDLCRMSPELGGNR
jgi:hypothetical protein